MDEKPVSLVEMLEAAPNGTFNVSPIAAHAGPKEIVAVLGVKDPEGTKAILPLSEIALLNLCGGALNVLARLAQDRKLLEVGTQVTHHPPGLTLPTGLVLPPGEN